MTPRNLFGDIDKSATISQCGLYRYDLTRTWGDNPPCVFIGLNPSTADATQDDPTIRRCIGFAKRWGCGGLVMLNLFAYRSTYPSALQFVADPIGPENTQTILIWSHAEIIVAAWGVHGEYRNRDYEIGIALRGRLKCLGLTKYGHPRHPLYLPKSAQLQPFEVAE